MTWRLAEQLFYNKGRKERSTESGSGLGGGDEKWSGRDPHPWQGTQKRRGLSPALGFSLGRVLSHILGTPTLGYSSGKRNSLSWFENQWHLQGCKKPRLCFWRVHAQTHLLSVTAQRQQIEDCLGPWPACMDPSSMPPSLYQAPVPAPLFPALLPTKGEAAIANKSVHTWRDASPASEQVGDSHCQPVLWCIHSGGSEASSMVWRWPPPKCASLHTLRRKWG